MWPHTLESALEDYRTTSIAKNRKSIAKKQKVNAYAIKKKK
jgi:hypothetical protein